MKNFITKCLVIVWAISLTSCAASYNSISPSNLNYSSNKQVANGVDFAYKYDVLSAKGNKKNANKEKKNGVKLIAVKVTNNSDAPIIIGKNAFFYSGNSQVILMDPEAINSLIKQSTGTYFLYLIGTLTTLQVTNSSTSSMGSSSSTKVIPIGLIIGPGLTLINVLTSSKANKDLLQELNSQSINNKTINKGETVYGIIGVRDIGYDPLTLKLN